MGIGLLYARTGSLNLAQIGQTLAGRHPDGLVVVAFALLAGGFLIKAAVVPFHFWLPDAYGLGPDPGLRAVRRGAERTRAVRPDPGVGHRLLRPGGRARPAAAGGAARARDRDGAGRGGDGAGADPAQADAGVRHHEPPGYLPDRGRPADLARPGGRLAAGDRGRPRQVGAVPRGRRRAASAGQLPQENKLRRAAAGAWRSPVSLVAGWRAGAGRPAALRVLGRARAAGGGGRPGWAAVAGNRDRADRGVVQRGGAAGGRTDLAGLGGGGEPIARCRH